MIELLLKAGADPNQEDSNRTLLMQTDDVRTAELLLQYGADPNARNNRGEFALRDALISSSCSCEHVQLLLDHGADTNLCTDDGSSIWSIIKKVSVPVLDNKATVY